MWEFQELDRIIHNQAKPACPALGHTKLTKYNAGHGGISDAFSCFSIACILEPIRRFGKGEVLFAINRLGRPLMERHHWVWGEKYFHFLYVSTKVVAIGTRHMEQRITISPHVVGSGNSPDPIHHRHQLLPGEELLYSTVRPAVPPLAFALSRDCASNSGGTMVVNLSRSRTEPMIAPTLELLNSRPLLREAGIGEVIPRSAEAVPLVDCICMSVRSTNNTYIKRHYWNEQNPNSPWCLF